MSLALLPPLDDSPLSVSVDVAHGCVLLAGEFDHGSAHLLTDALGNVGVIAGGLLVWMMGWNWADPAVSVLIGALVIWSSWHLLRESVGVLLEGTPPHIDVEAVRTALLEVPDVEAVHDLHVWTITSGMPALSAHVTVTNAALADRGVGSILDDLSGCVAGHFGIDHATFQIEPVSHRAHEHLGEIEHA